MLNPEAMKCGTPVCPHNARTKIPTRRKMTPSEGGRADLFRKKMTFCDRQRDWMKIVETFLQLSHTVVCRTGATVGSNCV